MKFQAHARLAAAALGSALAFGAVAQGLPSEAPPPGTPGQVMTDTAPLPAEDRSSTGAIVRQNAPVRAQQGNAFSKAGERTGVTSVGRNATRVLTQSQTRSDLAAASDAEKDALQRSGAGSLTKQ